MKMYASPATIYYVAINVYLLQQRYCMFWDQTLIYMFDGIIVFNQS